MKIYSKVWSYLIVIAGLFLVVSTACKKPKTIPAPEIGSVTDIDGNVYKTIKIGNQWWMAENLKVTRYCNGQNIKNVNNYDTLTWNHLTTGGRCVYDDNTNAPGLLYNWYAINDTGNIAPVGWHVPSDDEWKQLEKFLGMSAGDADKVNWRGTHEGEKLKMQGTAMWQPYGDVWATNESGFSALAGSCRLFNGIWGDPGIQFTGFWWSSTLNSANNQAWYRHLDYKKTNVFRFYGPQTYGFSVRCIKNQW
jgi:uncharacterized protein (TIGR02145 family)